MAVNVNSPDALAGVFSCGSWSHERIQAYDQIVAMLKKLPVGARLRSDDDRKLNSKAVVAVNAFLTDLPDFKDHNGIAAWHEGSPHVLKELQNIGSTFSSELLRRQTVMAGRCSFRVVLETVPGLQNLLPTQTLSNIIWHVIVLDECNMTDLRLAIAKEGKFCCSADRNAVNRVITNVQFNVGQYRSSKTKKGKKGKAYLCYADEMCELRSIDGFYDVSVVRINPRGLRKKKNKNSLQSPNAVDVKGTQEAGGKKGSNAVPPEIREPGSKSPLEDDSERSERLSRRRDQKSEALDDRLERESQARKSESLDTQPQPTQGGFTPSDILTTADAGTVDTLLLRMGHAFVETKPNGFCGYLSLSEMYGVHSPFDLISYWRAVFLSRVLDTATTVAKTAATDAKKAEGGDAQAKAKKATTAAGVLKEAKEACALTIPGLSFKFVSPWIVPPGSTNALSTARSSPSPKLRLQKLLEYLDEEIEKDNRDSDGSAYRRLKSVISWMDTFRSIRAANDQRFGRRDPIASNNMLDKHGWVNDSLVALQAVVDGVDILIADGSCLTLRKANGVQLMLGRVKTKHGYTNATTALQRSTVQGNVWSRRSLAIAVGGLITTKGKLKPLFPNGRSGDSKVRSVFARPSCWVKTKSAILPDVWDWVIEYLPYFKVLILSNKNHWDWAYPNPRLSVKERLGRFTPKELRKKTPLKVLGLSLSKAQWWHPLNARIERCVAEAGLRTPVRTGWAFRYYIIHEIDWGGIVGPNQQMPPNQQQAYPRLHHECGVKSLFVAVMAGLDRAYRPASVAVMSQLLVEHLEASLWFYRSLTGPYDVPLKCALVLLRGSDVQHRAIEEFADPLAVPQAIAVILVAVSRVFKLNLSLEFHHGSGMNGPAVGYFLPRRMPETHYHPYSSTGMAHPEEQLIPRGTLHLAWLHIEGERNSPVFFLLEVGPDRNACFDAVHMSDELVHEFEASPPPTTTALTIYRGADGLMLLKAGEDPRSQMYDVRPSGVVPDGTVFVRWRETAAWPTLGKQTRQRNEWSELIEVRVGCSVMDLKCQEHDPGLWSDIDGAFYILDHTLNGEGMEMLAKIKSAAGYAALRSHAKLQATRDDLGAEVRAAMVDGHDGTRIVNPPWSAFNDFVWEKSRLTNEKGEIMYSTTGLLKGTCRHADVPQPTRVTYWLPRPNRPLPCAGMRVRTYDAAGIAIDNYVLQYSHVDDQVWLQREFVLTPSELMQVEAEHDAEIPDEQGLFAVMYPQFIYLINMPLHAWVSLHEPTLPMHVRTDQVITDGAQKDGFAPACVEGFTKLRINRSNLLSPLLYMTKKKRGKSWRSLDYCWMLENWDSEHFRMPPGYPLTMKEWLQYGADGDVMFQSNGCSGVTDGGILPLVNPFVRLATLSPNIKHVDNRDHCVSRSILLLGFVEDADVPRVANWAPRVCMMPLDGSKGTLIHSLKEFNDGTAEYYINTHEVYKFTNDVAYEAQVDTIQKDGMHGIAEVAVEDHDCEAGVRYNHVMAVVNGCLVDPSDGSAHGWPDRKLRADNGSWLRDVTLFVPMTKKRRLVKKKRMTSKERNSKKRAMTESLGTLVKGASMKSTRLKRDRTYTKTTTTTNTTTTTHSHSTTSTSSSTTTTTIEEQFGP
jgi:hypothetical protein